MNEKALQIILNFLLRFVATGSIVSEVSYSENGRPATVERKTTRYSSDPKDFAREIDLDFKTSTKERKNSRGGVYSVTKVEKFEDDGKSRVKTTPSPSSKIVRNGSVKELKEKFVKKDSSSKLTERSSKSETKRSSVDFRDSEGESESYKMSKQYRKSSKDSKSFLDNEKKASNIQEVLTYMRNADNGELVASHEHSVCWQNLVTASAGGDSKDDAEARALFNKFLGASALMSTIENNSGLSKEFLSTGSSSKNQRVSLISTNDAHKFPKRQPPKKENTRRKGFPL